MNNIQINTPKREYIKPQLECIALDNEIALALQSSPPDGPGESYIPSVYNDATMPFKA